MQVREMKVVRMALVIVGLAAALFLQQERVERFRTENAALRQKVGELAAARAEQKQGASRQPVAAEAAKLQEQQAELRRLRGEVTRLRNEARQHAARVATAGPPAAASSPVSAEPEADPVPFTAAATANVSSGQTFATGGWLTAPGSRTFLLATPTLDDGAAEAKMITVTMCLLKVAEGDLPEGILRKLQDQTQSGSPVLTGTEAAFLMSKAAADEGTNVISRPRIATSDGTPANLFIGESRPNPDGTQRQIGTKIDLSPQVAQDGRTINMGVTIEYVPREEQASGEAPAKAN